MQEMSAWGSEAAVAVAAMETETAKTARPQRAPTWQVVLAVVAVSVMIAQIIVETPLERTMQVVAVGETLEAAANKLKETKAHVGYQQRWVWVPHQPRRQALTQVEALLSVLSLFSIGPAQESVYSLRKQGWLPPASLSSSPRFSPRSEGGIFFPP